MKNNKQIIKTGYFGKYGGRFVPPALEKNLEELTAAFVAAINDKKFTEELGRLLKNYAGRPSLLYEAANLSRQVGGAKILLKREDLNHTGSHKINNTLGQGLLAKRMGKTQLLAETGAGQHGVAVATVAALLGMKARIFMGARDIKNQHMNVERMRLLGAEVVPVTTGQATLKDAVDVALGAYVTDPSAYYLLGSAVGPHPYPLMVREFQKIIGIEAKKQCKKLIGKLPDAVIACVGGGSNALGLFTAFVDETTVKIIAAEPAGMGSETKRHGLSLMCGSMGMIHGFKTRVLHDELGEIRESYSAASGLDYPGVGPELSDLYDCGRVQVDPVTDVEAVQAMVTLSRSEGIIPALESAHAVAAGIKLAATLPKSATIIINLSGRGDKDVEHVVVEFPDQIQEQLV